MYFCIVIIFITFQKQQKMITTTETREDQLIEDLSKLFINANCKKTLDKIFYSYSEDEIKEAFYFLSSDYLLTTVQTEQQNAKKQKTRKLLTLDQWIKYLCKNICTKDDLKYSMKYVYNDIENGKMVATDAHILYVQNYSDFDENISDYSEQIHTLVNNAYLVKYVNDSFILDKYGDIINDKLDCKYPNYENILPERNYFDGPYFFISELLFNGIKKLQTVAKKLRFKNVAVKLPICFDKYHFVDLFKLCKYIDLHVQIYGVNTAICLTRNGGEHSALYNVDFRFKSMLLLMGITMDEISKKDRLFIDLNF